MKLYHADEHLECYQYSKEDAILDIISLQKDEELTIRSEHTVICFVFEGSLNLKYKNALNQCVNKEELVLIPLHSPCVIKALEETIILKIKLTVNISFCTHLPFELFIEEYEEFKEENNLGWLMPNQRVTDFAHILKGYIEDGLRCSFFFEIKIRELLYLIRVYYDKREVSTFFSPIFCNDLIFSNKVYENIDRIKNIKELAKRVNYSTSGFEKRFKKVFNTSPYVWLLEQKSRKIYHEINSTKKTFSEIAYEFDFSSPAHFSNFCKKYFGNTPGKLRRINKERAAILFDPNAMRQE